MESGVGAQPLGKSLNGELTSPTFFKVCKKCDEEKEISSFRPRRDRGTLVPYCKPCERIIKAEWRQGNKGRENEYLKKWRASNPDKVVMYAKVNCANKRADEKISIHDIEKVFVNPACNSCGKNEDLTIDHIIPLSKGGRNHFENLQVLCGPCNSSKGTAAARKGN